MIELYFDEWDSREAAWASPQGTAWDADRLQFADTARTIWSTVNVGGR